MPLLLSKAINDHSAYLVWNIQETNEELQKIFSEDVAPNKLLSKQAEWIVGRILIKQLCKQFDIPFEGVETETTGKPNLKNHKAEISISHSFPMAAAMINTSQPCGIDLERPRHKMIQVRDKFINGSEKKYADDLSKLCAIWCAKEVLYKIHNRRRLSLKDDTSIRFISDEMVIGTINKSNSKGPQSFNIALEEVKGYMLAYNV